MDHVTVGHRLVDVVSAKLGVPVSEIMGSRGNPGLSARKVVYQAMRDRGIAWTTIASVFGRDHSTVMSSVKRMTDEERALAAQVNELLTDTSTFFLQLCPQENGVEVAVVDPQVGQRVVLEQALADALIAGVFATETRVLGLR